MYREQGFVERCHCEAEAIAGCAACGRARCARHLERGLCNRCTQFIGREIEKRATRPWISAFSIAGGGLIGLLVAGAAAASLVAAPVGVGAYFAHRALQRRGLIRKMGPALSASKGELPPPPPGEPPFPSAPPPNPYIF